MQSFWQVWQEIVPEEHKEDRERASQLEMLLKYHSTFLSFSYAGVIRFNYEDKWITLSKKDRPERQYTCVVSHRNRFKI